MTQVRCIFHELWVLQLLVSLAPISQYDMNLSRETSAFDYMHETEYQL